jgi:hypothetical protein
MIEENWRISKKLGSFYINNKVYLVMNKSKDINKKKIPI